MAFKFKLPKISLPKKSAGKPIAKAIAAPTAIKPTARAGIALSKSSAGKSVATKIAGAGIKKVAAKAVGKAVAKAGVKTGLKAVAGMLPFGGTAVSLLEGGVEVAGALRGAKRGVARPGGGFFSVGQKGKVGRIDKYGNQRIMRIPSVAHIGKNLPSHKQITRLRRNLRRHRADALTILKLTGGTPTKDYRVRQRTFRKRRN